MLFQGASHNGQTGIELSRYCELKKEAEREAVRSKAERADREERERIEAEQRGFERRKGSKPIGCGVETWRGKLVHRNDE
jgi:hypothetical protein